MNAASPLISFLFLILRFKETYQLDLILYCPLDPGLHHTPDPSLQTTLHHANYDPFGRTKIKGKQVLDYKNATF